MPTLLGYEIKEQLCERRSSLIYSATSQQRTEQTEVILKTLKDPYPSPAKIARFNLEYEILHDMQAGQDLGKAPDNVIRAFEMGFDQNRWCMVLEDFGGKSLDQIQQQSELTLEEFLIIALKIVDGLHQIHQRKLIHKDINPSNIVWNPVTEELKIIDFGIATLLTRETPTVRDPNMLEGTLAYLSPEQTGRMNRALDYRTDYYSLGVTFFELLTGRPPFCGNRSVGVVACPYC